MVVNVYATSATVEQCSRNELLAFVNNFLRANFTRIEEMSSGAAYCQLTELLFPGKISLKKVKWNSRNEVDWIGNWRLLQTAWKDLGVKKGVPVERLLRSKFQDNFEFLQWFKKFFDANYDGHQYDALQARNGEPLPASWTLSSRSVPSKSFVIAKNNSFITSAKKNPFSAGRITEAGKSSVPNTATLQRKHELMEAEGSPTVSRDEILVILYEIEEGFAIVDQESKEPNYEKSGQIDNNDSKGNAALQFEPNISETF
uniref:Calponin-homology (CH) domain-containing protein n=1 Tax=Loa loa TaxID=7209 RepID=A0A1I7VJN1_LOALO